MEKSLILKGPKLTSDMAARDNISKIKTRKKEEGKRALPRSCGALKILLLC
jgi:hypothetical protein